MKSVYTRIITVLGISVLITGCGRNSTENKEKKTEQATITESATVNNDETEDFFPTSYAGGSETVKFDCALEVPEEFEAQNFYLPEITGIQYIDSDAAYANYVEGKEVTETYHYPSDDEETPDENIYILADGSIVAISGVDGLQYNAAESGKYLYVMRATEEGASHEDFEFETGENCVNQVKAALAAVSYPVDEFRFSWFSLSGEEHGELEQAALENGEIDEEDVVGDWTDKDEYEIYAWQTYGGLPVFHPYMTSALTRAFESYQKATVSSVFTQNGIQTLAANLPYLFEKTDEKVDFLPFAEIAAAVEERYEKLLTDSVYTVKRAKLAMRVYVDQKQKYAAEPIWYFEVVDNNGGIEVILFDAGSGEEIFLQ